MAGRRDTREPTGADGVCDSAVLVSVVSASSRPLDELICLFQKKNRELPTGEETRGEEATRSRSSGAVVIVTRPGLGSRCPPTKMPGKGHVWAREKQHAIRFPAGLSSSAALPTGPFGLQSWYTRLCSARRGWPARAMAGHASIARPHAKITSSASHRGTH